MTCENFCFCERCYKKNKEHLHKFKREKVQNQYKPPKNSRDLIERAYMLCHTCGDCLLEQSKRVYICQECTTDLNKGDTLYFCLKCKNAGDKHEHKLTKFKGILEEEEGEGGAGEDSKKKEFLENLLDEYYTMDFEDLIGGGQIKTRFKYRKVGKEDFGLTEDEILLLDDKQLNKLVSLKKYRPYLDTQANPEDERPNKQRQHREFDQPVNLQRIKSLKNKLQDELREKRKMLKLSLQ